jgi:hypothetical protein
MSACNNFSTDLFFKTNLWQGFVRKITAYMTLAEKITCPNLIALISNVAENMERVPNGKGINLYWKWPTLFLLSSYLAQPPLSSAGTGRLYLLLHKEKKDWEKKIRRYFGSWGGGGRGGCIRETTEIKCVDLFPYYFLYGSKGHEPSLKLKCLAKTQTYRLKRRAHFRHRGASVLY